MFGLKKEIIKSIVEEIKQYDEIDSAVIFGSRARGNHKKTSDIDICIFAKQLSSKTLNLLRNDLDDLDIIYKIDLVHFTSLTKEPLKENIIKEGIEIYPNLKEEKNS